MKNYKPTSPGVRWKKIICSSFFKFKLKKKLSFFSKNFGGRSSFGNIIFKNRGSKLKKKKIIIDFNRTHLRVTSIVCGFFKKKTNSVFFNLIKYANGSYSYITCIHGVKLGQLLYFIDKPLRFSKKLMPGFVILLKFLPRNMVFSNICILNSNFAKYVKAAGTFTKIFQFFEDIQFITFKLPSGSVRYLSFNNFVTLGRNSNIFNWKQIDGKAGRNRLIGFRPNVRGVAMNPVDHPHGGRTKTNKPEVSPWGWVTKKGR